ncbi:hypothetical protein OG782_13055 [Streptomyces sp. NBC_00876]|uniref:hypothetical protein n=1 Tax=Streptomyces sp. NBC_00876 TaxID=2975853 RepID=UPI00386BCB94|nr:hypothetical protein OG782_13055 [Streptomyces sp. NBC_00876]
MPAAVSGLRTLMMIVGGIQAVLGLALVTNSAAIATSTWDGPDAPTPGETYSGTVVFVGILIMAGAAWGIITALKFPTRLPAVRNSAIAYGRVVLAFTVVLLMFLPFILSLIWLPPAILLAVRPNRPECRAWFGEPGIGGPGTGGSGTREPGTRGPGTREPRGTRGPGLGPGYGRRH